MNDYELMKNCEGYPDPTAYEAIKHIEEEEKRFRRLLATIFYICDMAGFKLEEHIVVKDRRTGRVWR